MGLYKNCLAGPCSSVHPLAGACPSSLVACMGKYSCPCAGGGCQVPGAWCGAETWPARIWGLRIREVLLHSTAKVCPDTGKAQTNNYQTEFVLPEEITNEIILRSHHCGADKVKIQEPLFSADVL